MFPSDDEKEHGMAGSDVGDGCLCGGILVVEGNDLICERSGHCVASKDEESYDDNK